jgi:hypothetical protein
MSFLFGLIVFLTPQKQEFVCFVNDTFQDNCGTIGYSVSKKVATKVAFELCERECGGPCELSYCEKILRK